MARSRRSIPLDEVVGWQVDRTSPGRVTALRLVHVLKWVAVVAVNIPLAVWGGGESAGDVPRWRPIRPRLTHDVLEPLNVKEPNAGGDATWLKNRWTKDHPVTLYADKAEVTPLTETMDMPLEYLRVLNAEPTGRDRKDPRAPWLIELTDVREPRAIITIHGEWISLAWLGHLAGWPEPASDRPTVAEPT